MALIKTSKVKTPKTIKNKQFSIVGDTFYKNNNILIVLVIENHEFSKKNLEFLDKTCNYYEFSKWKLPRLLKLSCSLVLKPKSRESAVNQLQSNKGMV
jgi:hypothetical protein